MLCPMTTLPPFGILVQTLSLFYKGVRGQVAGRALFSFLDRNRKEFFTPDSETVGEAKGGQEPVEQSLRLHPYVTLMDLVMSRADGLDAIRRVMAVRWKANVLVVTSFSGGDQVFPTSEAWTWVNLLKDSGR